MRRTPTDKKWELPKKQTHHPRVYFDHAAATPLAPAARAAMEPFFADSFGNPSALYARGRAARSAVEQARHAIAACIGATPTEIIFTGSGTESDNLAIRGVYEACGVPHAHMITTAIEHPAVLSTMRALEKRGCAISYCPVDKNGMVDPSAVMALVRPETVLVSIMYVNNEVGTIQPIAEVGRKILQWRTGQKSQFPYFHTDACQAAGYVDMDVRRLHVDFLTANGSKAYGPKGTGFLYRRRGAALASVMTGGGQEFGLRAGTEHGAGIVGLAAAFTETYALREQECARVGALRDRLWRDIQEHISDVVLNGHPDHRVPNSLSVTFKDVDAEALILYLDEYGIEAGTGSACSTESDEPSHVLRAMGRSHEACNGTVRFTLGRGTTEEAIAYCMSVLPALVRMVRSLKV